MNTPEIEAGFASLAKAITAGVARKRSSQSTKTAHHWLVLDGRQHRMVPRNCKKPRRFAPRTAHNRVLGEALLASFIENGRRLTAGMRRDLGLDG